MFLQFLRDDKRFVSADIPFKPVAILALFWRVVRVLFISHPPHGVARLCYFDDTGCVNVIPHTEDCEVSYTGSLTKTVFQWIWRWGSREQCCLLFQLTFL